MHDAILTPFHKDLLTSGYFREIENGRSKLVPKDILNEVSKFSAEFDFHFKGKFGLTEKENKVVESTLNDRIKHKSKVIKLMSSGCADSKYLFILTMDNKLYQVGDNDEMKEMEMSFMRNKYDEIIDIQSGTEHCLFLTKFGDVYSVGANDSGQCGLGVETGYVATPTLIPMANDIKIRAISCGSLHSLFIDESRRLLVCGYNYSGQCGIESVGDGFEVNSESDTSSTNKMDFFSDNDANYGFGGFMDSDSEEEEDFFDTDIFCFSTPTINPYFNGKNVAKIACGDFHSICITKNGECYTFGCNHAGNLGNGTTTEYGSGISKPFKLKLQHKIIDVAAGSNHNILLTEKNDVICFGDNTRNQCNDTEKKVISSPTFIAKDKELEIAKNSFVENVMCFENKSLIITNPNKRFLN